MVLTPSILDLNLARRSNGSNNWERHGQHSMEVCVSGASEQQKIEEQQKAAAGAEEQWKAAEKKAHDDAS